MKMKYKTTEAWVEAQLKYWWDLRHLPRSLASFSWHGEEELGIDHILAFFGGRDASLLAQSNFQVINRDMQKRFPDDVGDVGMGHGTDVRWDQMLVRVKDEKGQLTEAAYALEDWYLRLEDYPVADEEHYSNLQYVADILAIANHYVNREYCDTSTLEDGWMHKVYEYLSDIGVHGQGESFDYKDINEALWGLGYTKQYECSHCQTKWAAKYDDCAKEWGMYPNQEETAQFWEAYGQITERDEQYEHFMKQIKEHRLAVRVRQAQGTDMFGEYHELIAPPIWGDYGLIVVVHGGVAICPVCLVGEFDVV